jgi:hypothetical protein
MQKRNKHQLVPLPEKNKDDYTDDKLVRDSMRHRMQVAKVIPSSQGLISDFLSLVHMEMTKLAGSIGVESDCLDENRSKHLSRLITSLDRLVKLEGDVRGLSEIDRMDDSDLKRRIKDALKTLKIGDSEIEEMIKNATDG